MNSKQKLDSSKEDEVVERMARVGFNTIFEDEWDELNPISSEHTLWLQIASNMLTELRRTWEESKGVNRGRNIDEALENKGHC